MKGEIITIGNELISGRVLDLNAWYAAGRLTASGLKVTRVTTVGDDPEKLSSAIRDAVEQSQFVIITGGLGATEDDITNEMLSPSTQREMCAGFRLWKTRCDFIFSPAFLTRCATCSTSLYCPRY
ncbi:MAG: hypothetical protein JRI84_13325 [Deltaproteobacteria bacterium]|nr:hypothetical protein [Deltaproteobacteria bacterium]